MNRNTFWAFASAVVLAPTASLAAISADDGLTLMGIKAAPAFVMDEGAFETARRGRGGDTPRSEWRSDSQPTDSGNRGWNREDDRTRDADEDEEKEDDPKDADKQSDENRG